MEVFRVPFALDLGVHGYSRGQLAFHMGPHLVLGAPCPQRAQLALDLGH